MKSSLSVAPLGAVVLLLAVASITGCDLFTLPLKVAAPTFSPPAGSYEAAQHVAISTATKGASVRYTTDGTVPTAEKGKLYAEPVSVSSTTTIRAIAFKSGMDDSSVASAAYTIILPSVMSGLTVGNGGGTVENPLGGRLEVPGGALARQVRLSGHLLR